MSAGFTPAPWALNRLDSAEEFARLKGETLEPHEGYYRANSGAWIVTASQTDEEGYPVGSPIAEVTFKGQAKRGEAYKAPDPEGQANARLIAAAPSLYAELNEARMALKRIEQDPRTPTAMRDIAGARAYYAECALAKARGESAK